jgi:hypothetical protein
LTKFTERKSSSALRSSANSYCEYFNVIAARISCEGTKVPAGIRLAIPAIQENKDTLECDSKAPLRSYLATRLQNKIVTYALNGNNLFWNDSIWSELYS